VRTFQQRKSSGESLTRSRSFTVPFAWEAVVHAPADATRVADDRRARLPGDRSGLEGSRKSIADKPVVVGPSSDCRPAAASWLIWTNSSASKTRRPQWIRSSCRAARSMWTWRRCVRNGLIAPRRTVQRLKRFTRLHSAETSIFFMSARLGRQKSRGLVISKRGEDVGPPGAPVPQLIGACSATSRHARHALLPPAREYWLQ
jgi:hypothetical protein